MAQSIGNKVKFGINLNPTLPSPSFKTKTTTPATTKGYVPNTKQTITNPLRGVPGAVSTKPPVKTGGSTGLVGTSAPSSSGGSGNQSVLNQLGQIRAQAEGLQGQVNNFAAQQPPQMAPQQGSKGLFPTVLDSLINRSKSTKEQARLMKQMEETAAGNKAIADQARQYSEMYGNEINRVGQLGAGAVAGHKSTGTNVVGSGNAAIASQSASARIDALQKAQQAALEGTGQQLTAQEQTAQAIRPALEASLTQQQTGITGLSNAANYAQPVQVAPGSTLYGPDAGNMVAGGLGGWAEYTSAQQAQALMEQYPDVGIQYDPNQSAQQNLQRIQSALGQSPTYQRGTFGAAGAGSYIGAQQLGAAGTLTGQVAQLQTQGAAADANFNLMLDIVKRGKINDFNQPILNQITQNINRGLTSNDDVVAFRSALQTVRSQYAAILGGGTPTDATQAMAAEKIPDTVSLSALQEVERTMKTMVNNTVSAYNQQIGAYSNQGGGGGAGDWSW